MRKAWEHCVPVGADASIRGCWSQERVDGVLDAVDIQTLAMVSKPSLTLPERLLTVVTICSLQGIHSSQSISTQTISFGSPHIPGG